MLRYIVVIMFILSSPLKGKMWVRIFTDTPQETVLRLQSMGVDDITAVNPKGYVDVLLENQDILSTEDYVILDPNVELTFQNWREEGLLIDFGPYYTYDEATAELDNIHAEYPDLTTEKMSIGVTWEGRDIWAMKVSDNPNIDEDEPTLLLTGVHHAREPIGCTITIEFAKYLLSNYGVDPVVTWLVDNRELWIVPILNPDGYVYNQWSDGYWRKNTRDNNDNGVFDPNYDGVDLNRNYGFMWGYDNNGSSPDPTSQTYRGPSAFSEPETQAIRELCDSIQPLIALNYHSYSNLLLYPWGYQSSYTPDHQTYVAMSQIMTESNGYDYGTPWELLYHVNGDSDDWMYGEQTEKPKIFAFTPEVGESFWQPDTSIILQQIQENLPMNLYVLKAVGPFAEIVSYDLSDQGSSPSIDPGDTISLTVLIRNISPAGPLSNLSGVIRTTLPSSLVTIIDSTYDFGDLDPLPSPPVSNDGQPFRLKISNNFPEGGAVRLNLHLSSSTDNFEIDLPISFLVGQPVTVFIDSLNTLDAWVTGGNQNWGLTNTSYNSPPSSVTDSPYGNYGNQVTTYLRLVNPIDLSDATFARIIYYHKYDIENGWDYGYVQASSDGQNWITLKSYTGAQLAWLPDTIDLSSFTGSNLWIRFLLITDYSVTRDGWYVDDIMLQRDVPVGIQEEPVHYQSSYSNVKVEFNTFAPDFVRIIANQPTTVVIDLYDVSGHKVSTLLKGRVDKGTTILNVERKTLPSGVYFMRVNTPTTSRAFKFLNLDAQP